MRVLRSSRAYVTTADGLWQPSQYAPGRRPPNQNQRPVGPALRGPALGGPGAGRPGTGPSRGHQLAAASSRSSISPRVFAGSTGMLGPMVVVSATFLT